jgi:GNAT superfamily N-acetyltransferase
MARIQRFALEDLDELTRHSRILGWYNHDAWRCFLATGMVLGHVQEDSVLSTAYVSAYAGGLGWMGAFIVAPAMQGQGLGRQLLRACLDHHASGERGRIGLVPTSEGVHLYQRGGFTHVGGTFHLVSERGFRMGTVPPVPDMAIRSLDDCHWPSVLAMDAECVRADRERLLRAHGARALAKVVAVDQAERVRGFGFGALDGNGRRLIVGPIISDSTELAIVLVAHLAGSWDGTMQIDVLGEQSVLAHELMSRGFALERECPIMTYGGARLGFAPEYRAVVSRALG